MIHEILPVGWLQCNCSVFGDQEGGEAIVIDPGDEPGRILSVLRRHNLRLKLIVITHAHIDHLAGARKLKQATGAPVYMNEADLGLYRSVPEQALWIGLPEAPELAAIDASLGEGDKIQVGPAEGSVLHTPGHTQGSISIYFPGPDGKKLFAGDTLFKSSIGRTDLPGGSTEQILRSLHDKLLALDDDTLVIPGHGPLTTIGEEREENPFLQGL
jgi:glyoxylase-like metal-dependent hydrolase (beta-lactamase superfamily II)